MTRSWFKHPLSKFTMLVVLALLSTTARSAPENIPEGDPLVGQLLVASPRMGDPRFDRTVVLLVRHDSHGAMGIAINRPVEELPLASVMKAIGEDAKGVEGRALIFAGGPVEPEAGFVLHSIDYHRAKTLGISRFVAMTSTPEIFRDIAHKHGPKKFLMAFGYCGWGPGQLERELAQHAWFTAPADPKLIFDENRENVWDDAMAGRTRQL
jgi:putative transcriptional regulator